MRRPQGNAVVLGILRSRAHRMLSRMVIELQYTGRRSGRRYSLPVQYARSGDRLVVVPQDAAAKTWWRNFRTPQPVQVRLAGRQQGGTAVVVSPDDPGWAEHRGRYEQRWRRLGGKVPGPLILISLAAPTGTAPAEAEPGPA